MEPASALRAFISRAANNKTHRRSLLLHQIAEQNRSASPSKVRRGRLSFSPSHRTSDSFRMQSATILVDILARPATPLRNVACTPQVAEQFRRLSRSGAVRGNHAEPVSHSVRILHSSLNHSM